MRRRNVRQLTCSPRCGKVGRYSAGPGFACRTCFRAGTLRAYVMTSANERPASSY
ncbi:hypothetical protein KCP70_04850 [Salmonella enterica subsp. enterica]|nr:hypothetical protein KCP70_04850 [Salmonella enterica subsp. enterica]